ncbi:MAG TPA: thymidine phosphorylase family protein [Steroidobacteraceae bacterium]|nr:thymidine phosphorylase family protein [Steroidobacteraceae bacterium]
MSVGRERMFLMRAGIDTYQEPVVYMNADCAVCRSEGFAAQARVWVEVGSRRIIATLNVVTEGNWLPRDFAALSEVAWRHLAPQPGETVTFSHADAPDSARLIRSKVYGEKLDRDGFRLIMRDAIEGALADVELASFLAACAARPMSSAEIAQLTLAMVDVGERVQWHSSAVLDKHCVGGLAGNRTTPIVVAIVAACGGLIPKTSSRAITSPSGTADAMELLAPVNLSLDAMRAVVEREGGCVVWGGSVGLSPADDVLIRVERVLDFDSDAQLIASVLSKKSAAGAAHVLLDLPVGPTAKIRSVVAAEQLGIKLMEVGAAIGLNVRLHISDGRQPVGRGIGPALEARDVVAVLARSPDAPLDLRERALDLAGLLLELNGLAPGSGRARAQRALDDGSAARKFEAICDAQGGRREPPTAPHTATITAAHAGTVSAVDNRLLSRLAKLAGAPRDPAAGLELHKHLGDGIESGEPLMTVHAETNGELQYALDYHTRHPRMIEVTS